MIALAAIAIVGLVAALFLPHNPVREPVNRAPAELHEEVAKT